MRKLKNLIILFPTFGTGGVTNNLINFINFCSEKKINIFLISDISRKDKKLFKKKFVTFVSIKSFFLPKNSSRILTSILSIFLLIKLFFNFSSKDTLIFSFQSHILTIIFCKIFFKKIIIRNSEDIFQATKFADNKIFAYFTLLLKFLFYRFCNGIITNSTKSKKSMEKIVRKKTKLIFNPYLKKIYKYKRIKRNNIILSVGRLCKQKNQSTLIKAFDIFSKKYPNYNLLIIGHGVDNKKLKNLALNLNLEKKIKFLGRKTNLEKYYTYSKIFVFPSLYEGLPNALIDSVNYNLPCISTDCSGARDILGNNYKDFVKNDDPKMLAQSMIRMIKFYDTKLANIAKIKKNLNLFMVEKQSLKYLEYCEKFL